MREILFRGKPLGNLHGKFIYGSLGVIDTDLCAIYHCFEFNDDEIQLVDIGTVGQYTGLTDKNDKKIFEGDILKNIESNRIVAICYGGCSFCYSYNGIIYGIDDSETGLEMNEWEIIGNIYDNPELLEVSK